MDIDWYDHDSNKIGHICQISNNAQCEMLQMMIDHWAPQVKGQVTKCEWLKLLNG
jgi:hypothetical protein